jgi:tetratricopeptide (TPR) repeat protein
VLLVVWWSASSAQAQAPATPMLLADSASVRLMEAGRAQIWDLRLTKAEQTFRELEAHPSGAYAAHFHLATIALLRAVFTDSQASFDVFLSQSDTLLTRLEACGASAWCTYLNAEAHLHRAIIWGKMERYVRAALAARGAYKRYEDVITTDSTFYEAYAGMGLFHVMIGGLPSTYQRLLSILGYRGSVPQGLDELQTAIRHSQYARRKAQTLYALTDLLLNNAKGGAVDILGTLAEQHPDSPLFRYLYGYALLVTRQSEAAETQLRIARQLGTSAEHFFVDYAEFYLAQSLFHQNRFDEAIPFYRHYIERHQGIALKAVAHLELGLSLEMAGKREQALTFYRGAQTDREFDSDLYARRLAEERLSAPMGPLEQRLLLGRNAYDAGRYAKALDHLRPIREKGSTDQRAEAAYRMGRVYQAQGQLDRALAAYQYVIDHPSPDPTARWTPWAQYYIGEIHAGRGHTDAARSAYEAALAYEGDFDYYQSLEQQARVGLTELRDD